MKKIALLSASSILGFFDPSKSAEHALDKKGASAGDLTHFTLDYLALTNALSNQGVVHEIVSWSDPSIDWSDYDAVLIHTPWDYYEHKTEFLKTLQLIESKTVLLNAYNTVQWNIDKKYLQDLIHAGLYVIETIFIDPNEVENILDIIPEHFWENGCVFKPTVSAGAADVFLLNHREEAPTIFNTHFKNKHETLMVQPFVEEIKQEGEWSFIFFDGKYSHAVLKKTVDEGFAVKHSTENQKYKPTEDMLAQAIAIFERLLAIRKDNPLYTRLDTVLRPNGQLCIMEVEQIEPFLYLHARVGAAEDLVQGIMRRASAQSQ